MHNRLIFEWWQEMFRTVSPEEWDLSELSDAPRRQRLLNPPTAESLLTRLIDEATQAAEANKIWPYLEQHTSKPVYPRLHAQIPVSECTFDLLFNGRSGYRAQYYLSPHEGDKYNRQIIDGLTPVIRLACTGRPETAAVPDLIESSLKRPAKLAWYKDDNDGLIFRHGRNFLNVPRWKEYWSSMPEEPMGLKVFSLGVPRVFLKGAFVDKDGSLHDTKPNRSNELYETGWT